MLIQQKKIPRVVISLLDPFPSVNGMGARQLIDAGIQVETGCLKDEGAFINRRFLTYLLKKRPYVILKWAQTSDGFMDLEREPGDPVGTNWISGPVCRTLVHKWRAEESAIMVGTGTIITDNPRLNLRRWSGDQPIRVTIDRSGRIPASAHILSGDQDTIVFTTLAGNYSGKTRSIRIDPSYGIADLLEELHEQKIVSILVEGGARLLNAFLDEGLWDEARVLTGPMTFSQGVQAPHMSMDPYEAADISGTKLEVYTNNILLES
jgi:diaminohydroxyphosphoribosylaminopyrimidine deaminase/5-amino-6-(5-phosphoribosylamino)uracil reductase